MMSGNCCESVLSEHAGNASNIGLIGWDMTRIRHITLLPTSSTRHTCFVRSTLIIPSCQDPRHAYWTGSTRTIRALIITTTWKTTRLWTHARGRAFSRGGGDVTILTIYSG